MSPLNSEVVALSARVVEPRTSANSIDNSTSAPASSFRMVCSQALQSRGLKLEGRVNDSQLPSPDNGRLHSKQRGSPGNRPAIQERRLTMNSCSLLMPSLISPVRYQYQVASNFFLRFSSICFLCMASFHESGRRTDSGVQPRDAGPFVQCDFCSWSSGLHDFFDSGV